MKKLFIGAVICITLILAVSINAFGLVQLNVENTVSGTCNTAVLNELSLSGNAVVPIIGIKVEGEYDSGTFGGISYNNFMAGAGFRLFDLAGLSLFAGVEYLDSTISEIAPVKVNAIFYDASMELRIGKHMSVDAWMGNSLIAYYEGVSSPGNQVFAYRARFTYWFIDNIGASGGIKGTSMKTDVPLLNNYNFNGVYFGASFRL
jgi:hypothetical protein